MYNYSLIFTSCCPRFHSRGINKDKNLYARFHFPKLGSW